MAPLRQLRKEYVILAALFSFALLACGPLEQLRTFNQQRQAVATSAAVIDRSSHLVANSYEKWQVLPGYRLESRSTIRNSSGYQSEQRLVIEYDPDRNAHIQLQRPGDQGHTEFYVVGGHTYQFEPQYGGWTNLGSITPAELGQAGGTLLTAPAQVQLLTQLGTVPTKVGRDRIKERSATRYKLEYIVTTLAAALNRKLADPPVDLRGMIWIDEKTGALLKSELLLYEEKSSQPIQEFVLELSDIGQIDPIGVPSPLVDPEAIVSATATAQAWTVMTVNLKYEEAEPISFELIPVRVMKAPPSSPGRVEVQLMMRRLPKTLFNGTELERFVGHLRQQLSLSVPNHNMIAKSTGLHIKSRDSAAYGAEVAYFFDVDISNATHVELVISGEGNPLFAPVPVEERK